MTLESENLIGSTLGGSYRITRLLGKGGMGAVYEAHGVRLPDKRFAVKLLHQALNAGEEVYERFRREATIVSRLGHPNIVEVIDFDHTADGRPFMVMEYLEGEDLEQALPPEGPLALEQALPIFAGVCAGLQAAHEQGVVHRDIKPQNIFLQRQGEEQIPKLLDFGISKLQGASTDITGSRATLGTPHYMSPEQAWGISARVGARSDIFSLGAVLYRTLTGTPPFKGESLVAVIHAVAETEPAPVHEVAPGIPPAVSAVVARALAKEPEKRPASADDLLAQLRQAATGSFSRASTAPDLEPPPRQPRRRSKSGLALILLVLALLAGAAVMYLARPDGPARVAALVDQPPAVGLRDAGADSNSRLAAALAAALKSEAASLTACFTPALARNPDLEGSVGFKLVFGDRGQVLDVRVERDGLGDAAVAACAAARLRKLSPLPKMAGKVSTVPYYFAPARTLAVLPFQNLAGDATMEWLRGGMAEALISRLGQVPNLVLLERSRVRTLLAGGGGGERALLPAAREAGADLLLQGAFQRLGSTLRITARLTRTRDGKIRSTAEATGELEQVFGLQDRLAGDMVGALSGAFSTGGDKKSLSVLRLLGQAHNALMEAGERDSLARAEVLYRQVIRAADHVPEAYFGLAMALWPRRDGKGGAVNREIKAHLNRALELRPAYHEAMSSLGFILWNEQRYDQAFELQQRALRLKPTYAHGYFGLGLGHATRGNGEQALTLLRQAVELAPRDSEFHTELGICVAAFKRDFRKARRHTAAALKLHGGVLWNHVNHAFMELLAGDARSCLKTIEGSPLEGPYNAPHLGQRLLVQAACLASLGETARAAKLVAELPPRARAMLGDPPPPGLPAHLKILLKDLRGFLDPVTRSGG